MSKFALANGTSGLVLGGVAAAGAVALALYASGSLFPSNTSDTSDAQVAPQTATAPTPEQGVVAPQHEVSEQAAPDAEAVAAAVEPEPTVAPNPDTPTEPAETATAGDAPVVEGVEDVTSAETEAQDTPALAPEAPAFDIVRVAPDGQTLVAGRAPGAQGVTIFVNGVEAGSAEVDGSGKFVAFLDLPTSDVPRVVSLLSVGELGQAESVDQVILAPVVRTAEAFELQAEPDLQPDPPAAPQNEAEAAPETEGAPVELAAVPEQRENEGTQPGEAETASTDTNPMQQDITPSVEMAETTETATAETTASTAPENAITDTTAPAPEPERTATDTTAPAEPPSTAPASLEETAPAASAPAVILSTEAGVNVLQTGGAAPQALDQIALDSITYEDAGAVALTGRGSADEFVRVYLDNQPVQTTEIGADGQWRAELPDVDTGTYTLRVDAVDASGDVTSRVESPFRREDPVALAQAANRAGGPSVIKVVTVQPGNTLWAIARDRYGEGPAYVKVFEANRDRIRDPDLIYPGQVFSIPE